MGMFAYLYNVLFLCLFACAAFFCGVTRELTHDRQFGLLMILMVLLALEGIVDMGAALVSGNFALGSIGDGSPLSSFDICKALFQMGEQIIFYLLACDILKRRPPVAPFFIIPLLAIVRCTVASVNRTWQADLFFLIEDPVVVIVICLCGLAGLRSDNEWDNHRRTTRLVLSICIGAYACSVAEDIIYALLFTMGHSLPFYVGKISLFEDALWAGLSIACMVYARQFQEEFNKHKTEQLIHDRLAMYRLEIERQENESQVLDIENFCALYELTPRERETLELLLAGMSNQQIADEMMISLGTVKTHVHSVYRKLAVSRRSELMGMFYEKSRA